MKWWTVPGALAAVFLIAPAAWAQQQPPAPALPVVLDWSPGVGDPGGIVVMDQAANEKLARHIYLRRVIDDGRELHIAWKVEPEGDWPAKENLFAGGKYPSGVLTIPKGVREAAIDIPTVATGKPDWHREFRVVLTDAATGQPILGPFMLPVEVTFLVYGDLKCAPGRPDLCDPDEDDALRGNPFGVDPKTPKQ